MKLIYCEILDGKHRTEEALGMVGQIYDIVSSDLEARGP